MPQSTRALASLFGVTPSGPEPLPLSEEQQQSDLHKLMLRLPPGVYSALRTFHHERFLWLDEHIARTVRSMRGLGWDYELDLAALRRALQRVARDWPGADARVRFDVLAAPAPELGTASRVILGIGAFEPVPEKYLREGVQVEIAAGLERHEPRIKTTEFILRRQPYPLAQQERYEHLLLDHEQRILEGSSSNFFGVQRGGLRTSGPGVLEGITRKVLVHIARAMGIAIDERALPLSAVGRLDEAFLTSSTRGVVPIVGVAGTRIGAGRPGELTQRLMRAYDEFAMREARPAV
jgi:branched-subunit amino acid aminotransferase/4-amino-4-deoxychorismate lyase